MDDIHRRAGRDIGGALVAVMGMIPAMAFAIWLAGEVQPNHDISGARKPVDHVQSEIDAARGRAIGWATPECRSRVVKAVARAGTERAIADAAWAACPDHPDALD